MGQLRKMGIEPAGVDRFDGRPGGPVELEAPGGSEGILERRTHQGVGEVVPAGVRFLDESGADGRGEGLDDRALGLTARLGEDGEIEPFPQYGGRAPASRGCGPGGG